VHEKREDFVQIKKNASRRKEEEENHSLQSTTLAGVHASIYSPERRKKDEENVMHNL
jgi:hypothetical protein